jgi:hypothetical protein
LTVISGARFTISDPTSILSVVKENVPRVEITMDNVMLMQITHPNCNSVGID